MRVTTFFGTRPETIKVSPFIQEGLRLGHEVKIIFTGQHREMALPLLDFFNLKPDVDLNVMRPDQTLTSLSSLILSALDEIPGIRDTDAFLVQGDTTTAFIGAYWAFLNKIPVIHLEAGLRTYNLDAPFPEEGNRQLISRIARVHFAPTPEALTLLAKEGIVSHAHMIGNTGIDTLRLVSEKLSPEILPHELIEFIGDKKLILITGHRRENFGRGMKDIARAIKELASELPEVRFIYPVHLNPNVKDVMSEELSGIKNLLLWRPLEYLPFISLMKKASVILTDSGGIQEEAPTLRTPVVVMRESTERPEGVRQGFSILTGTSPEKIKAAVKASLDNGCRGTGPNPYGDGYSSQKAWKILTQKGVII